MASRSGDMRVWIWSGAVFFVLSAVWSLTTPLMGAPDEDAHAIRAAGIWFGTLTGEVETTTTPLDDSSDPPVTYRTFSHVEVPRAYDDLRAMPGCFKYFAHISAECAPPMSTDMTRVDSVTAAGTYQPTYYVLVGWPTRLLEPRLAVRLMRLLSAAIGSALLASAMVSARRCARSPVTIIGVALAITPIALFLLGSINPNGLEIAAAIATWAGLFEIWRSDRAIDRSVVARLAIAASLFALSRPLAPVFVVIAVASTALTCSTRARAASLMRSQRARIGAAAIIASMVASGIWVLATHANSSYTGTSIPSMTTRAALDKHLGRLTMLTEELVGNMGWLDAPIPRGWVWSWLALIGVVVVTALWRGTWRQRLGLSAIIITTLAIPMYSEVTTAQRFGFMWQGRYTLPFAVGVPITAAWMIAARERSSGTSVRRLRHRLTPVAVATAIITPLTMIVAHLVYATRATIGYPNPLFEHLTERNWSPPLDPKLLGLSVLAACIAYAAFLTWHTLVERPEPAAPDVGPLETGPGAP